MKPETINQYAQDIHRQNVARGWWDDPNPCVYTKLQLVNTEVAEATEGDRRSTADKPHMDDHLKHRAMAEVELADTFIRLADIAGKYGWKYTPWTSKCGAVIRVEKARSLPEAHFWITAAVCAVGAACAYSNATAGPYTRAMGSIVRIAEREGYDLQGAIDEKLAYNATRADHNKENRGIAGGKRY